MPDQTGGGPSSISAGNWFAWPCMVFLSERKESGPAKAPWENSPPPAQDLVMPAIQENFGVRGSFGGGEGAPRAQLEEPLLGSASFGAPELVANDIGYPHLGGGVLPKLLPHDWKPGAGCLQIQ